MLGESKVWNHNCSLFKSVKSFLEYHTEITESSRYKYNPQLHMYIGRQELSIDALCRRHVHLRLPLHHRHQLPHHSGQDQEQGHQTADMVGINYFVQLQRELHD